MATRPSFLKNSVMTVGRQLMTVAFVFFTLIVIARVLGPGGQGKYSLAILLPLLLANFLNFGLGPSSVYYLGKRQVDIHTLVKTNVVVGLVISLAGIALGSGIIYFFSESLFGGVPKIYLYLMLFVLPFMLLKLYFQAVFQGLEDFRSYNTIIVSGQALTFVLVLLFLLLLQRGLFFALLANAAGQMLTVFLAVYVLYRNRAFSFRSGKFSRKYFKKAFAYGIKSHLSNIMAFLNYRADVFLISFFLFPQAVGLYMVAVNFCERLWLIPQSIALVLFPRISSLEEELDKNRVTSIVSRNVFTLAILCGVILFIFADMIITLFFGPEYSESAEVLKILLPGIVLTSVGKILSNDLAARGKPEINMYTAIFVVTTNIVLNLWFIPLYGIKGAALATTVAYGLNWTIKVLLYKKLSGESFSDFLILKRTDLRFYQTVLQKVKMISKG